MDTPGPPVYRGMPPRFRSRRPGFRPTDVSVAEARSSIMGLGSTRTGRTGPGPWPGPWMDGVCDGRGSVVQPARSTSPHPRRSMRRPARGDVTDLKTMAERKYLSSRDLSHRKLENRGQNGGHPPWFSDSDPDQSVRRRSRIAVDPRPGRCARTRTSIPRDFKSPYSVIESGS